MAAKVAEIPRLSWGISARAKRKPGTLAPGFPVNPRVAAFPLPFFALPEQDSNRQPAG
jgi:hypothetical protein